MKVFIKGSQRTSIFIVAAFLLVTAVAFGSSFVATQQAGAVSGLIDPEAPTVPGVPTTTTPTKNATMVWNWSEATDLPANSALASGIKNYQYRFSGQSGIITDWTDVATTSVTTVAPYDGLYQLEVRAVDNAGNVGTASVGNAHYDLTGPTVVITSPTNGTVVGTTKKLEIVGATGDASSYTLSIGKTGQTPVVSVSGTTFTSYTWDTTNVPNNSYIVTLTGTDEIGNVSSAEVLVTVSNPTTPTNPTNPTVTVNSAKFTSRPFVVTGTMSTDTTRIAITVLDARGRVVETGFATLTAGKTTWSYTVKANLDNANYTVQAHATNAAGAAADAKAGITVAVQCYSLLALLAALLGCWFF